MAVDPVNYQKTMEQIVNDTAKNTTDRNTGELGETDFLNLLTTQLRYQDPLKPMDDTSFIGQMAQFTALQQTKDLNTNATASKAFSLIGKNVTANFTDDTTKETTTLQGDVTNVKMADGKVYLVVKGKDVPVENVTEVAEGGIGASDNIAQYENLIGSNVDGFVYNSTNGDVVGVSGIVNSIQKGTYENYADLNGVSVNISDIVSSTNSTDPTFKSNYMSENIGKQIDVNVIDQSTGKKVEVKATLKDYTIDGSGSIKATLDHVYVPVESVYSITHKQQGNVAEYTHLIGMNAKGSIQDSTGQNTVSVNGTVKSITTENDLNFAVMDGITFQVSSVNSTTTSSDPNTISDYLSQHSGSSSTAGNVVSLNVKDPISGQIVAVSGTLDTYGTDPETGKPWVKLNQVNVPVDSITDVTSVNQG